MRIIVLSPKPAFISDRLYICPQRKLVRCLFGQLPQQSGTGGGYQIQTQPEDTQTKNSVWKRRIIRCHQEQTRAPRPLSNQLVPFIVSERSRSQTKDGSYDKHSCQSGIYHRDQHPDRELTQDTSRVFSEVLMQSAQSGDL